jgi:signal transduction histidine kinase
LNTIKTRKRLPFRSKIVLRLWLIMMLLVVFAISFIWVAQIFLFEQNFINATVTEVQSRLQPIMNDIETVDLAQNQQLILSVSKATNGKMVLAENNGKVIAFYNSGHRQIDSETLDEMSAIIKYIMQTKEYKQILQGKPYYKIIRYSSNPIALETGIPVTYDGQKATVFLFDSLDQLQTVLRINRNQLITLSVIMTLISAALAAFLSRRFVKPIHIIKSTVDKLAKGDLNASPNLTMSDELGQLSVSVADLGIALKRVDVLRKEVIANVSHELRAPLALIKGYAEMVRDINWKDDDKRTNDLDLIINEAGRMSEMVSDIMDYSQLQAGYIQLRMDRYNLYEIVESEVDRSRQNASEFEIEIKLESVADDIPANVDALKISQVIRNLLNNAINHTLDKGKISVVIEKKDRIIKVSVINPGDPIPIEDREIIWERYQRSQHHGGRKKGTGIGLSIVSAFLKAHNMAYGVNCNEGLTTFWFECYVDK